MMHRGFSTHNLITQKKELFGRDDIFNQLLFCARSRRTISIIGLRRFGKTSILKCLEYELMADKSNKIYPIYFDFKEVGSIIKGTDNVYRYMISRLIENLYRNQHFVEDFTFKRITISPVEDWTDNYENLKNVDAVKIQGLFEELILFFAEYLDMTFLFLIDEYEYLFRFSFDSPVGFMKLRNLASKIGENKLNPFCFFIAGALTWEYLCTITGSGELNIVDQTVFLKPIDRISFKSLWEFETSLLTDCNINLTNGEEFGFNASGGVPFYGKLIGFNWVSNSKKPEYFILKSYFQEIFDSLQKEEQDILIDLAKVPRKYQKSKYVLELIEKGLIYHNQDRLEIRIGFLKDYIKAKYLTIQTSNITPEEYVLTDNIASLIITINNTHYSKKGTYVFEPVNDDAALLKDLRTKCTNNDQFSNFACSIYKIIFEKTKSIVNGKDVALTRLPKPYKRGFQFIDIIDIMRHSLGGGHLMDMFINRPGQMTKSKMLEILLGSKNDPNSSTEFYSLQIATLRMFENELKAINNIVRNQI